MDFIIENYAVIISLIALLIAVVITIKNFVELPTNKQITKVKEWLLYAVVLAEKQYGAGTGEIKLRYVYDLFVEKFSWLAKVVSFETFSKWVQDALKQMEALLQTNSAIETIVKDDK